MISPAHLSLQKKGFLLVAVPLVFELVFLGILVYMLDQAERDLGKESKSKIILSISHNLEQGLLDSITLISAYAATGDALCARRFEEIVTLSTNGFAEARRLVGPRSACLQDLDSLELVEMKAFEKLALAKGDIQDGNVNKAVQTLRRDAPEMNQLFQEFSSRCKAFQNKIAQEASPPARIQRQHVRTYLLAGVLSNIVICLALAGFYGRTIVSRLQIIMANAERFARHESLHPELSGSDEIASLDRTVHNMERGLTHAWNLLQASEEQNRLIMQSMPVGIAVVAADQSLEWSNAKLEEMTGYTLTELTVRRWQDILPEPRDRRLEPNQNSPGTSPAPLQATLVKASGEALPVQLSVSTIHAAGESKLLLMIEDVSARLEMENLKREFVNIVSHDLRTPLTSLAVMLESFNMPVYATFTDRGLGALERMQNETARLQRLVRDLLDLARIESGKLGLSLSDEPIATAIDAAIDSVRYLADQKHITIKHDGDNPPLAMDTDRIIQVIVNLLSNAIKFSPEGGQILIHTSREDDWLKTAVIDAGPGIAADKLELIFERFGQVSKDDAKVRGGTGLGLTIAKLIVESHQGKIGVESQPGKGSQFWFALPCSPGTTLVVPLTVDQEAV